MRGSAVVWAECVDCECGSATCVLGMLLEQTQSLRTAQAHATLIMCLAYPIQDSAQVLRKMLHCCTLHQNARHINPWQIVGSHMLALVLNLYSGHYGQYHCVDRERMSRLQSLHITPEATRNFGELHHLSSLLLQEPQKTANFHTCATATGLAQHL